MMTFHVRGVLHDIEGTLSSIAYVQETLFSYARGRMAYFFRMHWNDPGMEEWRDEVARHFGSESFEAWTGGRGMPPEYRLAQLHQALVGLMNQDAKVGILKRLQGWIWQQGYADGSLRSHVYPDALGALRRWHKKGVDQRIYSSGSVEAQQLFFTHVENGTPEGLNLTAVFSGFFDTQTGPKRDEASYRRIVQAFGLPAGEILFLSDVPMELDAAKAAGMQTVWVCRPDNAHLAERANHPAVGSLDEIKIVVPKPESAPSLAPLPV